MAVSAFRSTSRRGNLGTSSNASDSNPDNSTKKIPHRRSRSVSALSRNHLDTSSSSSSPSSTVVEFLNKRDNPLFCSSSSSPGDLLESEDVIDAARYDDQGSKLGSKISKSVESGVSDFPRGRSTSRSSDCWNQPSGTRKETGRSLSRVEMGRRRRSVSRGHYGKSESEAEQEYGLSSSCRNNKINKNLNSNMEQKTNLINVASESSNKMGTLHTWSSRHPLLEPSSDDSALVARTSNWEDGISTSSFSEGEEKTIKAVFEQMKSFQSDHPVGDSNNGGIYETVRSEVRRAVSEIQNDLESAVRRKNAVIMATTNVADIPPELVNPDAVELVSDIRREYARKLEQSQERARKLRADLAVEEHRGQELSRILKEVLPDPKTPDLQKSRPRRKTSSERRKMSKRLTEEAMTYFDECVSISTFDSSDFSSLEDPPQNLMADNTILGGNRIFPSESSSTSINYCSENHSNNKESDMQVHFSSGIEGFNSPANSSSKESHKVQSNLEGINRDRIGNQFSFAMEPTESFGLLQDIRNYIKKFENDVKEDNTDYRIAEPNLYDMDDYKLQASAEGLLFDRVVFKNRIESGGLLLCCRGIAI